MSVRGGAGCKSFKADEEGWPYIRVVRNMDGKHEQKLGQELKGEEHGCSSLN